MNGKSRSVDSIELCPESERCQIEDIDFFAEVAGLCKVAKVEPVIEANFGLVIIVVDIEHA